MKKFPVVCFVLVVVLMAGCSKKGDVVVEPNLARVRFTTYTVDTLTLKVFLNGTLVTDTLKTPQSVYESFAYLNGTSFDAPLKIENASTGQVYIDSIFTLEPGAVTISFVQFLSGQNLAVAPVPNEPEPAAGNYKVRFQYVPPVSDTIVFLDSIKCVLQIASAPVDTFILHHYETSPFFEESLGTNYRLRILDPVTDAVIDNATNNLISTNFTVFNTAAIFATSPTNYNLKRIY